MAIKNHFADIVKFCSILPVFAVMPAMAENTPFLATTDQVLSGTYNGYENNDKNRGGVATISYKTDGVTVANGTVFENNKTLVSAGGAIKALNGIEIGDNVQFINNSAVKPGWGGGALYVQLANKAEQSPNTKLNIGKNNKFSGNSAMFGGAIALEYGDLTVGDGTVFENNVAQSSGDGLGGGAIAIWQDPSRPDLHSNLTLNNVSFVGNSAQGHGGAIGSFDTGANININKGSFANNVAKTFGGAVYNTGKTTISGTNFSGNRAETQGYGGAIFNSNGGLLTVDNATFRNNSASWDGGAISSTTSHLNKNKLPSDWTQGEWSVENVRKYWLEKNGFDAANKMVITNSTFENNMADEYSGGALGIYSDADIKNSVFTGNNAGGHNPADDVDGGGAIYAGGWARVDLTDSEFSGNSSNFGGAIATTRAGLVDDTYLKISGSRFANNTATVSGGAISNKFEDTTIKNTEFSGNTAGKSGGAIYNVGKIVFEGNNVFAGNTAAGVANDIYNIGTMTIANGTTTIGGGITGDGILNVAEGATLDIGTATVSQGTLDIDGNIVASIVNSSSYGKLRGSIDAGENAMLTLNIGAVGTYDIFEDQVDMEIKYNDSLYNITTSDAGIVVETKSVEEIAEKTNLSTGASATLVGMANSDNYAMSVVSLKAQQALEAGNTEYVETETAKLKADDKPVAHSVSTSVQNQVLALASGRMSGGAMVGRNGGDLANADYGVWAQGLFNKSKLNGQFHGYTRGIALGADTLIDGKYTIGIGYAFNSTDVHTNARDTDIESNSIFAYGQYKPSQWYINGALNYTMSEYTETTNVFDVGIENKYDVDAFGGQVMTGYDFASGFTPEAGVRYLHISQDDYNNGLADIQVGDTDFLTGVAGIKYAFEIESESALKLSPELRAAATYDFLSDEAIATIAMPGAASYIVGSDRLSRFGGEFGIGLSAQYKGLEVSVNYELDLHEDYTSQTGMLKFRYDF